jgi:hypothetical protein
MLKRLLMETDLEKVKAMIEKLDHFKLLEFPELDERIANLKVELNSAGFDRYPFCIFFIKNIFALKQRA